jgi:hypothetical protein
MNMLYLLEIVTWRALTICSGKKQSCAQQKTFFSGAVVFDITLSVPSGAIWGDTTFTGTVTNLSKAMVGLSNVDITPDASKPVSTATLTALGKNEYKISVQLPLKWATNANLAGDLVADLSIDSTADVILNTTLNGNLSVVGFNSAKPYVSLRVATAA